MHLNNVRHLQQELNVLEFENEWSRFLTDINSVPEILKTSARGFPKSFQWVSSEMKNIIRRDPTLGYLWHARGTDFHGLNGGAEPDVVGADYLGYDEGISAEIVYSDGTSQNLGGAIVLSGDARKFSLSYRLVAVTDQFGNTFSPPEYCLEASLQDKSPAGIGEAAATYYRSLLSRSSGLLS